MYSELKLLGIEKWSIFNFPGKLYNYSNSNLVESFNGSIVKERKMNMAACLDSIITKYQEKFYSRSIKTFSNNLSAKILNKIKEQNYIKNEFKILEVSENTYYVSKSYCRYVVNTENKSCSCGIINLFGYPCLHFYSVIEYKSLEVKDFVDKCYHADEILKCYSNLSIPYSLNYSSNNDLKLGSQPIKKSRGRPKEKRIKNIMDKKNNK